MGAAQFCDVGGGDRRNAVLNCALLGLWRHGFVRYSTVCTVREKYSIVCCSACGQNLKDQRLLRIRTNGVDALPACVSTAAVVNMRRVVIHLANG